MKQVINHVTYNTDTATEVAREQDGIATDAYYTETRLYYSDRTGWFFYHEGGALSYCGKCIKEPSGGHQYVSGCYIEPARKKEARDFCAENGNYNDYVAYFGVPEEA